MRSISVSCSISIQLWSYGFSGKIIFSDHKDFNTKHVNHEIKLIRLLLSVCVVLPAFGQAISTPEHSGLSSERLRVIDKVLNEYVVRKEVAGGVALIARKGEIAYLNPFGMMNIEAKQSMKGDAIFRIASMTKAITVVAVLTLFEDGHFTLDDPISKFIPEFTGMNVLVVDTGKNQTFHLEKAKTPITIRHLLTHTSGLTYEFFGQKYLSDMYYENNIYSGLGETTGTLGEMIKRLSKLPLVSHPGEKWQYGLNMDVLGYLIEVITGKSLDRYVSEKIFSPLGMNDTYYYLPDEKLDKLVTLYGRNSDGALSKMNGSLIKDFAHYSDYETASKNKKYYPGGGGLLSTASDYFRFLQMLLNGGIYENKRILGRKTVELLVREHTGDMFDWWKGYGFGFGFAISRGPDKTGQLGSSGAYSWLGWFNTHYWVDPKEELIGILLTQTYPSQTDIDLRFKNLTYAAITD